MAAPSFVRASTGATDAGGAWAATGAAGTSGNIVIVQILQDGTTDGAVTFTGASHIENLAGTDNAWTAIPGPNTDGSWPIGSAATGRQFIKIGRLIDASAPTISGGNSTSEDLYWRFYEFTNVSTGTTLATVIENSTAGNATNGAGTSTTCSDTAVTTLGPDRLALNLVGLSDDAMGLGAFEGETGGDWILPVAIYEESSGTDATIALMQSYLGIASGGATTGAAVTIQGSGGTNEEQAQSFASGSGGSVTGVVLYGDKVLAPGDSLTVEIQTDAAGVPSGTVVGTGGTLAASAISSSPARSIFFPVSATLSASTTYWIVARRTGARDASNYYEIFHQAADAYAGGTPATKASGTWTAGTSDLNFSVLVGSGSTIDGGSDAITSIGWGVVGFALIGTTPSSIPHDLPLPQPSNFQNPAIF